VNVDDWLAKCQLEEFYYCGIYFFTKKDFKTFLLLIILNQLMKIIISFKSKKISKSNNRDKKKIINKNRILKIHTKSNHKKIKTLEGIDNN